MSLTSRLLLGFSVIAALGFWLMMAQVLDRMEQQYLESEEETMVDFANVLAELLARDIGRNGRFDPAAVQGAFAGAQSRALTAKIYSLLKTHVDLEVYVTDAENKVLFDSLHPEYAGRQMLRRDVMLTLKGSYGARTSIEKLPYRTSTVIYVAAPILLNGKTVGVVSIGKPEDSIFQFMAETRTWQVLTIGKLCLCMVLGSYLLARWTTAPIRRLRDYARAVSRGEKPAVPKMADVEMQTLGRAFEAMRDVLENREYVENYVQTLTHELKSPVAAIQGAAELLQESTMPETQRAKFLRNIQGETLRIQDLVDRLLALAALEKRKTLEQPVEVNLSDVAEELCDRFSPLLTQRHIKLDLWIQKSVHVTGDAFLLQTALGNLMQNAVDFSPDEGEISVGLKVQDGRAFFIVEDQGPGLPDYAGQRVFERFYSLPRPSSGRKSSGLGLCFVKEVALLHGGVVELENRDGEQGARAVFAMPLS